MRTSWQCLGMSQSPHCIHHTWSFSDANIPSWLNSIGVYGAKGALFIDGEDVRTDKSGHTHTEMRHDTPDGERHTCPMFNTLMANVGLSENQNVMHDGQISYCTKVLWLRRNLPLHAQVKFGIIKFIP